MQIETYEASEKLLELLAAAPVPVVSDGGGAAGPTQGDRAQRRPLTYSYRLVSQLADNSRAPRQVFTRHTTFRNAIKAVDKQREREDRILEAGVLPPMTWWIEELNQNGLWVRAVTGIHR